MNHFDKFRHVNQCTLVVQARLYRVSSWVRPCSDHRATQPTTRKRFRLVDPSVLIYILTVLLAGLTYIIGTLHPKPNNLLGRNQGGDKHSQYLL